MEPRRPYCDALDGRYPHDGHPPDEGTTWGSETILLDTAGSRSMHARLLVPDSPYALYVYGIERSPSDAGICSQVFTRA